MLEIKNNHSFEFLTKTSVKMLTNGCRSENAGPEEVPEDAINSNPDDDSDSSDSDDDDWYQEVLLVAGTYENDDDDDHDGTNGMVENRSEPLITMNLFDSENESSHSIHNYQVEWTSTDQPLFDRDSFESQIGSNNNNSDSSDSSDNSVTDSSDSDNDSQETLGEPSQPTTSTTDDGDPLDKEKIETIKNLMANFKLPDENYPDWAKNMPEEEWKNHLKKI